MLNDVKLIGHLGSDPVVKTTPNGQLVATLRLATTERWLDRNNNTWQESTEWHSVVAWGQSAQRAQERLFKGSKVFVSGKLKSRSWDDREGQKRTVVEVVAERLMPLDQQGSQGPNERPSYASAQPQTRAQPRQQSLKVEQPQVPEDELPYFDDDVPF